MNTKQSATFVADNTRQYELQDRARGDSANSSTTATGKKLDHKIIVPLISEILAIEKRYAHELTGVRDQRRKEIKELINKVVAEKVEK